METILGDEHGTPSVVLSGQPCIFRIIPDTVAENSLSFSRLMHDILENGKCEG
jgi:hypothetical protein